MSLAALRGSDYEAALMLPLPSRLSTRLCRKTFERIFQYVTWVRTEPAQRDPERAEQEQEKAMRRIMAIIDATHRSSNAIGAAATRLLTGADKLQ